MHTSTHYCNLLLQIPYSKTSIFYDMPCSSACHRYTSWLGTPHRPARISVHLLFITAHVLNTQHELQPQLHSHHFAPLQSQHTPNSNHSKCPYTTAAVHALWVCVANIFSSHKALSLSAFLFLAASSASVSSKRVCSGILGTSLGRRFFPFLLRASAPPSNRAWHTSLDPTRAAMCRG
mmetsp:Transcript_28547/g.77004  ORF Transcript_28547/g.77004 Transcript_28547/m.77004 type:complete len:178 (-) Transcript_28547:214-747(-)